MPRNIAAFRDPFLTDIATASDWCFKSETVAVDVSTAMVTVDPISLSPRVGRNGENGLSSTATNAARLPLAFRASLRARLSPQH
jgi:hypothetical protein